MGAVKTSRGCVLRFAISFLSALALPSVHAQTTVTGFTPGSFQVSPSGAATYAIPIQVPPGIAGMEPKLAFTYNSQGGNGLLGMGWSLSGLSAITRCPRTFAQDGMRGAVNYDANDRYCLDGQRLILVSGASYGADAAEYRTERDTFSKLISYGAAGNGPAWFKVWLKSGEILEYGNTADSRIEAQGKSTARVWALNKLSDRKGNYLTVTYSEDALNGDFYPTRVDYTANSNTALAPQQSVTFSYVTRSDQTPLYQAGSVSRTMNVLSTLKTFVGANQLREYRLAYPASSPTGRSVLDSITECAGPSGPCLAPLSFGWQAGVTNIVPWNWQSATFGSMNGYQHFFADVNGDGKVDWIRVAQGSNDARVGLSNGDGSFSMWTWQSTNIGSMNGYQHFFADVNGDGRADWIQVSRATNEAWVGLSNGDGSFTTWTWYSPNIMSMNTAQHFFADVNGDGRADWIQVARGSNDARVALSNGDGTFTTWSWSTSTISSVNSAQHFFADVDGDGKADWIQVAQGSNDGRVGLSNGDGSFATNPWTWQSTSIGAANSFNHYFADVNGDGKSDWIQVSLTSNASNVGLSNGNGSFPTWSWSTTNITAANSAQHFFADINGDGKADWIQVAQATADGRFGLSNGDGSFNVNPWTWQSTSVSAVNDAQPFFADVSGDGKADWIQVARTTDDGKVALASGAAPDLLSSVTDSLAATTTITYKALTDGTVYTKESSAVYPLIDLQPAVQVVSSVSASNGIGGNTVTDYSYGGLKAELGTGRGYLGLRWIEATDTQTGIKRRSDFRQDWPYSGLPAFAKRTQSSGAVLSQTTNTYSCTNPATGGTCAIAAGNRYFPYLAQGFEAGNDLNGTAFPANTTTLQFDSYGNATSLAVSTGEGYSKTTTNTYSNDTVNWLLGRLTRSSVQSTTPDIPPTSPTPPTVSISPSPLTISAPTVEAASGTATASAAGGVPPYTYSWSHLTGSRVSVSGSQTATFSTSVAYNDSFTESFRVTVTDAATNTATADLNVTAVGPGKPSAAASISPSPLSIGRTSTTGTATGTASVIASGVPPFTYSWSRLTGSRISFSGTQTATFSAEHRDVGLECECVWPDHSGPDMVRKG